MAHVAAFLQDNYQKSGLTIETLSRHFATNRTSLQARFKAFSGRTPASYLRLHRLSMARGALESTDTTVSEIALSVGFQDLTGFERAFARQYGLAPTAYRRLLRAGLPSV